MYAFERCYQEGPQLQDMQGRLVRCHLYPELQQLPPLNGNNSSWKVERENPQTILSVNDLSVHYVEKKGLLRREHAVVKAVDQLSFRLQQGKTLALGRGVRLWEDTNEEGNITFIACSWREH